MGPPTPASATVSLASCSCFWQSHFVLHHNVGRVRVERYRGQRFLEDTVMPCVANRGGPLHVWAGVHYGSRTTLGILHQNVNAESYVRLLKTRMVPHTRRDFGRNFLYQYTYDSSPAHRARRTQHYTWNRRKLNSCSGQHFHQTWTRHSMHGVLCAGQFRRDPSGQPTYGAGRCSCPGMGCFEPTIPQQANWISTKTHWRS